MAVYRKKPVDIEAIQIGKDVGQIHNFIGANGKISVKDGNVTVDIHTLEGDMHAQEGDYIIKGVQGEFYPCKQDIFEETYVGVSKGGGLDMSKMTDEEFADFLHDCEVDYYGHDDELDEDDEDEEDDSYDDDCYKDGRASCIAWLVGSMAVLAAAVAGVVCFIRRR